MYYSNDYLVHYGVQGMKWGQRKSRTTSGSSSRHNRTSKQSSIKNSAQNASARLRRTANTVGNYLKENKQVILATSIRVVGTTVVTGSVAAGALALASVGVNMAANAVANYDDSYNSKTTYSAHVKRNDE